MRDDTAVIEHWVVYHRPRDYPAHLYVVRRWEVRGEAITPREAYGARTVEAARSVVPRDRVRIERTPADDPCVVEVWL